MNDREGSRSRRLVLKSLAGLAAGGVSACDSPASSRDNVVLDAVKSVNYWLHRAMDRGSSLAQEFPESDISPSFRGNGTLQPADEDFLSLQQGGFAAWRLQVDGLVEAPQSLSLDELRSMPSRTQITRHDCVEGWSAIGKWKGVPLAAVLARARPLATARFAVFHCADSMDDPGVPSPSRYYESIDMTDANHPQTILAYELNDAALPVQNGAPLRLRVERQLGYKHAKYVMRVELVDSFRSIQGGCGGYWEDRGYEWYAGI
jgi:DMSO/TMAO reductase YedYZ molybdopterin-dependent catalytic subunit